MSGKRPASKKEAPGPPLANGMNAHSVPMCSHRVNPHASKKEAQGYPFASEAEAKVTDCSSKINALGVRMCFQIRSCITSKYRDGNLIIYGLLQTTWGAQTSFYILQENQPIP